MTVSDAEPNDIYVDENGKLWRCVGKLNEPSVIFEEVEGRTQSEWLAGAPVGAAYAPSPPPLPPIYKDQLSGGVSGLMWQGWKRVFRPESKA